MPRILSRSCWAAERLLLEPAARSEPPTAAAIWAFFDRCEATATACCATSLAGVRAPHLLLSNFLPPFCCCCCCCCCRRLFCRRSSRIRFWKIASSCWPTSTMNRCTLSRSTFGPSTRYPSDGSIRLYVVISRSIAPSRISNVGMCGKKSFPTKKQMKTKSSNRRSLSNANGSGCAALAPPNAAPPSSLSR